VFCDPYGTNLEPLTVNYDGQMQSFDYFDAKGEIDNVTFHRWVFTKRESYAFEEEVRVVENFGYRGIVHFPLYYFTGVHAGDHTSPDDIREVEAIIKQVGYSLDKVQIIQP